MSPCDPSGTCPFVRHNSQKTPGGTCLAVKLSGANYWVEPLLACGGWFLASGRSEAGTNRPRYCWKTAGGKTLLCVSLIPNVLLLWSKISLGIFFLYIEILEGSISRHLSVRVLELIFAQRSKEEEKKKRHSDTQIPTKVWLYSDHRAAILYISNK